MDVSKINAMGWKARITLEEGIRMVYGDYQKKLTVDG
jgi:nucleoside-diphosphate-sugar epimerase